MSSSSPNTTTSSDPVTQGRMEYAPLDERCASRGILLVSATISTFALAKRYVPKSNTKFVVGFLGTVLVYEAIDSAY